MAGRWGRGTPSLKKEKDGATLEVLRGACFGRAAFIAPAFVPRLTVVLPTTPLVKVSRRNTSYPWTGLPIKPVLVGTHVCCLLRDRRRATLFLLCTVETETKLVRPWETPSKYYNYDPSA